MLVLDAIFPDEGDKRGLELSMLVRRELGLETPIRIVITGKPSYPDCALAGRTGTWDYLEKKDVGNRAFADVVVESAIRRLQELDFRRELETAIMKDWLPSHYDDLEKQYSGQVVALWHEPEVTVVACGQDAYALAEQLKSWKHPEQDWKRPMFVKFASRVRQESGAVK